MKKNDYDDIYNWESYILEAGTIRQGYREHQIDKYTSYLIPTDDIKLHYCIYIPGEKDDFRFHIINVMNTYKVDIDSGKLLYEKKEKPKVITTLLQSDDFNQISEDFFSWHFSETTFENICNIELPKLITKDLKSYIEESDMFLKANTSSINQNLNSIELISNSISNELTNILNGLRKGNFEELINEMHIYQEKLGAAKVNHQEMEYLHESIKKADKMYLYNNLEDNLSINSSSTKRNKI